MSDTTPPTPSETSGSRRRNAATTRELLLRAGLARFTGDGYAATTLRQIATDAGFNVALIARYFGSKEGLFEACLRQAAGVLGDIASAVGADDRAAQADDEEPFVRIAEAISRLSAGVGPDGATNALLLLLRSSGDATAERMRVEVLNGFSDQLASASERPDPLEGKLRAQVLLATAVGIASLRSADGLEPLSSATRAHLAGPVRDVTTALLGGATSDTVPGSRPTLDGGTN